jgi:hypothetical protein
MGLRVAKRRSQTNEPVFLVATAECTLESPREFDAKRVGELGHFPAVEPVRETSLETRWKISISERHGRGS